MAAAALWAVVLLAGGPDLRVGLHRSAAELAVLGEGTLRRPGSAPQTVREPLLHLGDAPVDILPVGEQLVRCELRVTAGRATTRRSYRGSLQVRASSSRLTIVNQVALDDYLRGVVPLEIGSAAPAAALQAQAIAARSYALARRGDGQRPVADFEVATTQAYLGAGAETVATDAAVAATSGQMLTVDDEPVEAVYSACCGGLPAAAAEGWGTPIAGLRPGFGLPAGERWTDARLRQALAADVSPCRGGAGYRWSRTIDLARLPRTPKSCTVVQRGPSGRVLELRLETAQGAELLHADAIRRRLAQPESLPSLLFAMALQGSRLVLDGGGYGHGVGLCQAGAIGLAKQNRTAAEILAVYYPTAELIASPAP